MNKLNTVETNLFVMEGMSKNKEGQRLASTQRAWFVVVSVLFFIVSLAAGCSPVSENLAKKVQSSVDSRTSGIGRAEELSASSLSTLSSPDRIIIQSYGPVVRRYAQQYGLDWRLVLAVMNVESRFTHDVESDKGANGLMQIMPVTSEEVARVLDLEDMTHPMNNIHGGVFYLRKLYNLFEGAEESDRTKLALAAYNAGAGRVYDAQVVAAYLHDNPRKWDAIKEALPLLSKRYYTLHKSVWDQDRPKIAGWFGNARETVAYVDRVMEHYDAYRNILN